MYLPHEENSRIHRLLPRDQRIGYRCDNINYDKRLLSHTEAGNHVSSVWTPSIGVEIDRAQPGGEKSMVNVKYLMTIVFLAAGILCCGIFAPSHHFLSGEAYADPPDWAPAHGWREKHHRGRDEDDEYDDDEREHDYRYRQRVIIEPAPLPLIASHPYVEVNCDSQPILGTIIGGTAGGLIGNQFGKGNGKTAATISGILLGAVIGNDIGTELSRQNSDCMAQALEYARPGTQVAWRDRVQNTSYTLLPEKNYRNEEGQYCREYKAQVLVGGKMRDSYGTACRLPDGQWKIVE
jgi:surface antigen